MKTIYSGLESSGKTLRLAMVVADLAWRNSKWQEQIRTTRPIYSNFHFSEDFYEYCTTKLGVPIIYWKHIDELIQISEGDVIIDEVGNYFNSRMWSELSLEAMSWLQQGAKTGIEIYGGAQDFAQVDKAFRRLVNNLYHITKLLGSRRPSATKPPVKFIWGLCSMKELDPVGYDEDKSKFNSAQMIPSFFLIRKQFCFIFNTNQKIGKSRLMPLKHQERTCELNSCSFKKVSHV